MAKPQGHLCAQELAIDASDDREGERVRVHLAGCELCRRRRDDGVRLRRLLVETGNREQRPRHDVVPSAMMRLRLRRYGVSNANEFLEGFAAFVRGLASLFSVPSSQNRVDGPPQGGQGGPDEHG